MHVNPATFLPHLTGLHLDHLAITAESITLTLTCTRTTASCPLCHRRSHRVHSRYTRRLADLPWAGRLVVLHLHARRFVCLRATCARRIFCERLPALSAAYGRRTHLLGQALQQIGLALAGRAGARVAAQLGLPTSRMTLLRLVRALPVPVAPAPQAIGIDDWAQRRGHTYGTLIIDLERRRPLDLLPDRTVETVTAWLRGQPSIAVISRDRGHAYADGATAGAPQAVQVADRWHLAKNLAEALERYFTRQHRLLTQVAHAVASAEAAATTAAAPVAPVAPMAALTETPQPPCTPRQQDRAARRARRLARYEEVQARCGRGQSQRAIADALGLSRKTVQRYLHAPTFPEMQPRHRRRRTDPFLAYLQQRWAEGCHNGRQLFRELQQRGYSGGRSQVSDVVARLRRAQGFPEGRPGAGGRTTGAASVPLSSRHAAALCLRHPSALTERQQRAVQQVCGASAEAATVYRLAQDFMGVLRARRGQELAAWVAAATASGIKELHSFAQGLADDPAVQAGLTLTWSNGPTEGFVNKLKMLKRQMFGRAKLDLLRQRMLLA